MIPGRRNAIGRRKHIVCDRRQNPLGLRLRLDQRLLASGQPNETMELPHVRKMGTVRAELSYRHGLLQAVLEHLVRVPIRSTGESAVERFPQAGALVAQRGEEVLLAGLM